MAFMPCLAVNRVMYQQQALTEAGELDEETGKFYYFNKHLMGQTLTLPQGSKGWRARAARPLPSPRC
jgi:hypothetical protein